MIRDLFMGANIKSAICFDDVLLVPQHSKIRSRKDIDLSQKIPHIEMEIELPIISSPMDTVTEASMAEAMLNAGGLGIIHRYNSIDEQQAIVEELYSRVTTPEIEKPIGVAIGVTGDYLERALAMVTSGARIICVDIAHGHHDLMKHALRKLRRAVGGGVHIMAGNAATLQAFNDLADWGADSIRVGIGGGSICSTRIQTGHGIPTLASIVECSLSDRDALLIADGGIRTSGDIVKAIAAGANFVMLGSMLAGTDESPGDIIYNPVNDGRVKVYRGMASVEAQVDWRGHPVSVEGVSTVVEYRGPVGDILHGLEAGIRSGLSYSGAQNIVALQATSEFIRQTFSGAVESSTHILNS